MPLGDTGPSDLTGPCQQGHHPAPRACCRGLAHPLAASPASWSATGLSLGQLSQAGRRAHAGAGLGSNLRAMQAKLPMHCMHLVRDPEQCALGVDQHRAAGNCTSLFKCSQTGAPQGCPAARRLVPPNQAGACSGSSPSRRPLKASTASPSPPMLKARSACSLAVPHLQEHSCAVQCHIAQAQDCHLSHLPHRTADCRAVWSWCRLHCSPCMRQS